MKFAIPKRITQGDGLLWQENFPEYDASTDTLVCCILGKTKLTAVATNHNGFFQLGITPTDSNNLAPGVYKVQFVINPDSATRKTLGNTKIEVCPSFDNLNTLETRTPYEIELELVENAIRTGLKDGVAEYEIGDRKVRYQSLDELFKRQRYLKRQIAIARNPSLRRGRNVQIGFGY